jgi:hypothetical protein
MMRDVESSRTSLFTVLVLTLFALGVRLATIDFGLPNDQESDVHIFRQVHLLQLDEELTPEVLKEASIYPHLLARIILLFDDPLAPPEDPAGMTLAEHLARAGGLHVLIRSIVAVFSVLLVPATWLLARRVFGEGWALFATALVALSLLNLDYGQQARPHSFAAPFTAFAVAAAVRLRHRPNLGSWALYGLAAGLAIAALQNGIAVLLPLAVAFVLREREHRRWLEPRALVALGIIALFVRVFWPFAFVTSEGAETGIEGGTIRVSDQTMALSEFTGEGFPTVILTVWYYESVTFVLACVGLIVWLVSFFRRGDERVPGRGVDVLVMLSYALPYFLVIGMHERAQQRFVVQLLPYVALAATYGLRGVLLWFGHGAPGSGMVPRLVAVAALTVPLAATMSQMALRAKGTTLAEAGRWIEEHVAADEKVGIHLSFDVPLVRRLENQFVDGAWGGEPRKSILAGSPWNSYQRQHVGPDWPGERHWIDSLYFPGELILMGTSIDAVTKNPEAYLRGQEFDFLVLPGEHRARFHPMMQAVREAAIRMGKLELRLPREERMQVNAVYEGLDTPHYTAFILSAPQLGPELEIYDLRGSK